VFLHLFHPFFNASRQEELAKHTAKARAGPPSSPPSAAPAAPGASAGGAIGGIANFLGPTLLAVGYSLYDEWSSDTDKLIPRIDKT
jgi:hypothetical protein